MKYLGRKRKEIFLYMKQNPKNLNGRKVGKYEDRNRDQYPSHRKEMANTKKKNKPNKPKRIN